MAGLFGFFDFTRPGPGVPHPDDAPPRWRIAVFFDVLFRKFWNLVKLNSMFFLFNLPAIVAAMLATHFIFPGSLLDMNIQDVSEESLQWIELMFRIILASVLTCIPVVTVGPAQAGFTYILRNYAREEHAFLWSDFKDNAKKNFKQGLIVSIINYIVLISLGITVNFYLRQEGTMMFAASWILIMAFVFFAIMCMYIYPMMVTFKLSIKQLYKNAFLFTIMKLLPNIGMLLLCIVSIVLPYVILTAVGLNPMLMLLFYILIIVSLVGLMINFYVYPKIKKYILDKLDESRR